ncbi:MAG: DUF72 domain-containing protein [Candidatus Acidiferrales bacterium]
MGILRVGTSGYAYKPWKGSFYPEKLPDAEMLRFYGEQFDTVEINATFYRLPVESMVQKWGQQVPEGFEFAMKANQRITHIMKLRNVQDVLRRFLEVATVLQSTGRLGPVLVQLPPTFKADFGVLEEFLKLRPRAFRFALEVRHASWHTPQLHDVLRRYNTALCIAETDEDITPEAVTADFAYVRLRKNDYKPKELAAWREKFDGWLGQGMDVYAYCKHEDEGKAPLFARKLLNPGQG